MNNTPSNQEVSRLCSESLHRSQRRRAHTKHVKSVHHELFWMFGVIFLTLALAMIVSEATGVLK